ncbi:amidohydrolase family protein [Microbacterium protaetiae]|uniref:amidohydrolase family protein n=1 Tax=Microbacterium protaetiae TaxID=2509458 RepID=UPI0013EBD1A8|nr:amidohydrolase family protein [Microbacterium protaetiae]
MTLLDSHVHVWDAAVFDYPWLDTAPALPRQALPDDIDRADGLSTRMIFVEADRARDQGLLEAQWVDATAWPELAGIVAFADLAASDARLFDELSAIDRVVGVRHPLQNAPTHTWDVPALAAGLHELARRGLTFDACVRHTQLAALAELLERAPEAHIVLDHLGKPPIDAGLDSAAGRAWHDAVRRIAALPHAHVKLSGLAAEARDAAAYGQHADAFLAAGVDAFGADRAMIGSDWPVSARTGVGTTLTDWVTRIRHATGASDAEWVLLTEGTAATFYGV